MVWCNSSKFTLAIAIAALSIERDHGWTTKATTTTSVDRKVFLQTTGAAAVSGMFVPPAHAQQQQLHPPFSKHAIYQPPPSSLAGQVHVITGATTGLGLESAKRLAAAGATVVLTARTASKGETAKAAVESYLMQQQQPATKVYYLTLDLDHFDSIRSFPKRYQELMKGTPIDVLLNNAGVEMDTRQITDDGLERTFQSNHLGPFLLTALLFPYLRRDNGGARVINVSSVAHQFATSKSTKSPGLDFHNLNGELYSDSDWGSGWPAYQASKLENILFAQELQRRADAAGLNWFTAVSLHPGIVGTEIWRNTYVGNTNANPAQSFLSSLFYKSTLTTQEGANAQVWLAASPEIEKGKYYDENGQRKRLESFAQDPVQARELWEVSEKLAGIEFQVK